MVADLWWCEPGSAGDYLCLHLVGSLLENKASQWTKWSWDGKFWQYLVFLAQEGLKSVSTLELVCGPLGLPWLLPVSRSAKSNFHGQMSSHYMFKWDQLREESYCFCVSFWAIDCCPDLWLAAIGLGVKLWTWNSAVCILTNTGDSDVTIWEYLL